MKSLMTMALIGVLAAVGAVPVIAQVHKFFSPGTVWTVTMIKIAPGMDQSYMEYLDSQFKKGRSDTDAGLSGSRQVSRVGRDQICARTAAQIAVSVPL